MSKKFKTVLIANRGEIAVRVIRALREMGIRSVAVYSDADSDAPHVKMADSAIHIGESASAKSYLDAKRIIAAALEAGADAIHPGYGFLSENGDFADACAQAGIKFIGPTGAAIRSMGSKVASRRLMKQAGVPIVPGDTEPIPDAAQAQVRAEAVGFPVAFKASAGGGGKGLRVAQSADQVVSAFEGASAEGLRFFGSGEVYVERYLANPRHVEVQILADEHGTAIHLGERDCSVQRRHQKLIEESPAPMVDEKTRARIGEIAVRAVQTIGYTNAGTVEGLFADGEFYFLEMNTRLQVEHPVTELVTGIDLVRAQIEIAQGMPLRWRQQDIRTSGWAIECRINAEDAAKGFLPRPGTIDEYVEPAGPGVRVDSGVHCGSKVTAFYDPMIAKLIVWAETREMATQRMLRALDEYRIGGIQTLIPFHRTFLATDEWARGGAGHALLADKQFLSSIR